MYNYLDPNSPLSQFISSNASHLLQPLPGDTGISYSYLENLASDPSTTLLKSTYHPSDFSNNASVYTVQLQGSELSYVGSTTNFSSR